MSDETKKKLPRGIHRLPDGRLRIYATRRGKPVRLTVTWDLLAELKVPVPPTRLAHPGLELAQRALVKLRSRILEEERTGVVEGTVSARAKGRVTIGELLSLMKSDHAQKGLRDWNHVESRWHNHLRAHFGDIPASGLTSDHLDAYVARRRHERASGASVNRELAIVKHMLHLGMRCTPPRVSSIPYFPKQAESEPRQGFIEQYEYDMLCPHAKELWLRALLAVAYTFATRKSELLKGMRVRGVSLASNTIYLPGAVTKNGKPRTVVMTPEVRSLLAACIENKTPDAFVFTRANGEPVRDLRDAWKQMFEDAGVEPLLLHDMRRSAARNMIRAGIDRDTVRKIGGWKTESVFSRYNIQDNSDLAVAAKKIENRAAAIRRRARTTDKKTDNRGVPPSANDQVLQ